MLDISAGFFYARTYQPYTAVTDSLYTLLGVNYCGYSNGDSRFMYNRYTYSSMQNALTVMGHVPAVRVHRAINRIDVRKAYTRTLAFARRKSVTIAAISAALSVAGVVLSYDPLTYSAALSALGFVYIATEHQEGGDA